ERERERRKKEEGRRKSLLLIVDSASVTEERTFSSASVPEERTLASSQNVLVILYMLFGKSAIPIFDKYLGQ
ncbi:MAG: hypothetical protein HC786_21540, partial [Richelia sp. CSU_2_1]|nr:hypothetical protein [Richelia sp. CSU_2_1]